LYQFTYLLIVSKIDFDTLFFAGGHG
jgi:hypothetical protein